MDTIKAPSVGSTIGALFIGNVASCLVLGVLLAQAYKYMRLYPNDRIGYKLLVSTIIILELADQALITHASYFYCVTNYDNYLAVVFGDVTPSLILQITLGSLVGTIVRSCFAIRLWRFSKHNVFVTGTVFAIIVAHMALGTTYTVRAFSDRKLRNAVHLKDIGLASLGSGMAADLLTASALCYYLRQYKTGYSPADSMVTNLSRSAINTGIVTSGVSFATLMTYHFRPEDMIFIAEYFVLSKLYAISLLATLNTRKIIRGRGTDNKSGGTQDNTTALTGSVHLAPSALQKSKAQTAHANDWSYPPSQIPTRTDRKSVV